VAAVILGSWVGTLGWLAWRVYHRGGSAFTTGAVTVLPPDAFFFAIVVSGEQVGVASITVDTLTDGVGITELYGYDLPIQLSSSRSQFTNQYSLANDLRIRSFRLTYPGLGSPIIQQGTVEGDSILVVTPGTGAPSRRIRTGGMPLVPRVMATVALARQRGLRNGDRTRIGVFDPATLRQDSVELTVLDDSTVMIPDSAEFDPAANAWVAVHSDTMRAWRIAWKDSWQTLDLWVDPRGLPIALNATSGLWLYRSAFEIVNTNYRKARAAHAPSLPGNIVPRSTIASGVAPEGRVAELLLRIQVDIDRWPRTDDSRPPGWSREGDRIRIDTLERERVPAILPGSGSLELSLLSLDDPQLESRVDAIVGDERNPEQVIRLLTAWVAGEIQRTPNPVLEPAGVLLRSRRGDVDDHTLLLVALARKAGILARPVSGLLLVAGKFYFHSWAEVAIDQHWIPVDPTWNQFPADAGRLRLAVGGFAQPLQLLPLAAGLEITVDSARP
jgi:hypothetical protein